MVLVYKIGEDSQNNREQKTCDSLIFEFDSIRFSIFSIRFQFDFFSSFENIVDKS